MSTSTFECRLRSLWYIPIEENVAIFHNSREISRKSHIPRPKCRYVSVCSTTLARVTRPPFSILSQRRLDEGLEALALQLRWPLPLRVREHKILAANVSGGISMTFGMTRVRCC